MHSNIYQLYKYDNEYNEIPEWFENEIIDYYTEMYDKDRERAIEYLADVEKVDGYNITIGNEYLEKRWEYFREKRNELSNMTKKQFMGKCDKPYSAERLIHNVREAFSDEFGWWFELDGEMCTLEELERHYAGQTFRIGKVWDYHR